uniref:Methyltransferase domain-containing protein n=1 Tax=Candidatus Kentrum sp. DK TaxID=2126562 RepID=A0A450T6D3_9GAMM|nr:MAG: hypothetical protein BECKDK2373C_GA0170839_109513 [Candidatus Kentron sp. DK]
MCKFEANSGLFNEDLRKFWPISAFPQQNHPKSDRLLDTLLRNKASLNLSDQVIHSVTSSQNQSHHGAADRIKRQLSYRLGATLIERAGSFKGWLGMPWALRRQVREFRLENKARRDGDPPPMVSYVDAREAERCKQHLSYRLGVAMLANAHFPLGWLRMPWALGREARRFRRSTRFSYWLSYLSDLMPPASVVVVGAGSGSRIAQLAAWGVSTAHFIEADEDRFHRLRAKLRSKPHGRDNWQAHQALLWHKATDVTFHHANNAAESGVLPPETLLPPGHKLKTSRRTQRQATTLDTLLGDIGQRSSPNWLVVDCLPAAPIIRGANNYLDTCDVLIARVVLDAPRLPGAEATKTETDSLLHAHGFRCVAVRKERQPTIGSALYLRNWQVIARKLAIEKEKQTKLSTERLEQLAEANKAREEQTKLAAEHLERLQKTEQEHTELQYRQQLLNEELAKAEAQIELIKDLLLRETEL